MSKRRLAAIMFTDLEGYSRLMQENEKHARQIRDRHRKILEKEISAQGGKILQFYGDGTLSIFDSSINAVTAGIAIQQSMKEPPEIALRIGIHTGDVVMETDGIYGDGVNVASRIESLAVPGALMISGKLHDDIKNQEQIKTKSMGSYELKNVAQAVEIFCVTNNPLTVPRKGDIKGKVKEEYKTIAVLPFVNMSNDPDNEYFSDGVTEEILNKLAKQDGLQVTSRTSSFAFRGQDLDVREIGNQLNVSTLLEGSVRKFGNQVRITAQLISTENGFHIWSETFDRTLDNIFDVQDEIASHISTELRQRLFVGEVTSPEPSGEAFNFEAYNLFLKGSFHFNKWTPSDVKIASDLFQQSLGLDPDFVPPRAMLAASYLYLGLTGQLPPDQVLPKGEALAKEALELDPEHDVALTVVAMSEFMYQQNYEAAEGHFQKALVINPNNATSHHYYAIFLTGMKRYEAAEEHILKAQQLDPLSPIITNAIGDMYMMWVKFDKAREYHEKTLQLDPTFRASIEDLGWIELAEGNLDKAIETFQRYQGMTGSPLKGLTGLAAAYALTGQRSRAEDCLAKIKERQATDPEVTLDMDFAIVYGALGDEENATLHLENGLRKQMGFNWMETHPIWGMLFKDMPGIDRLLDQYVHSQHS